MISFVRNGLKDLSISRTSFNWGIEVPNNKKHIMYVWLDALTNYLTASNYFNKNCFWPASLHIIGKDILRFHAIYWPAFLMAAKIPLPKKIFGHGWILSGDEKMSKSKGNILDPIEIINEYGLDEIRYYLMKEVIYGLDGKINIDNLKNCINSDLANNIGNLSQRIITLVQKYFSSKVPDNEEYDKNEIKLVDIDLKLFRSNMQNLEIHNYVREIINYSSNINKYINDEEPWSKIKTNNKRVSVVLNVGLNALKNIFILLHPIMPKKSETFLKTLNISNHNISLKLINERISTNMLINKPEILFKKFNI